MKVPIIYEDTHMLAVNKPAGVMVHGDGKNREPTLADWILENYPEIKNIGEPLDSEKQLAFNTIERPGIVHRLDKETSGVLLIAKDQSTFLLLKKQFQARTIEKVYHAFVYGSVLRHEGIIEAPIGRSAKDFRLRSVGKAARGREREAITEYRVRASNKKYSFLEVFPHTGRTHQIRVHLKSIGHPVVCDSLYAPKRECPELLGRLALHASIIVCETHEGIRLRLEASLPRDFTSFLAYTFPDYSELRNQ